MENNRVKILRTDGRAADEMRPVIMRREFTKYAEGSVWIEIGDTQVICNTSIEEGVPEFLEGADKGWVTAEYSMLPRSTHTRMRRGGSGRASEIQRLIGRTLRTVVDLSGIGPRTVRVDCDVIQADGGTRTAAITGAFVALHDAFQWLLDSDGIASIPIKEYVAATSVGIVNGVPMLDLCYEEDSDAGVDLNVVMTKSGRIIEVQGTAEREPFARKTLDELLDLAAIGIEKLIESQTAAIEAAGAA